MPLDQPDAGEIHLETPDVDATAQNSNLTLSSHSSSIDTHNGRIELGGSQKDLRPDEDPPVESKVDVEQAEKSFADLRRQLTQASSAHLSVQGKAKDLEKQAGHVAFDLLEYLRPPSQTQDGNSVHPKTLGVVFENLGVLGAGGMKLPIRTFPDALMGLFMAPVVAVMMRLKSFPPKQILHPMSGFLKPGEMCLVLGRPNSGCSTFLKAIANQRIGFIRVDGDVTYGGLPAGVMAKQFKGEVVYNPEDDIHLPTLTVAQTLKFALSTKAPARLLPHISKDAFIEKVMDIFLQMLGISHTKNTMVGDAHVRGVSGGERKRVSIAEMMATRACVLSWDNSTRGLDASTALEYAKSLRILANLFSATIFVTLYQAGEGIYEQFDKVLLLNEGRMAYFGPAKEARPYLIGLGYKNLPRQTTADYLTGCTDPNERQFQDGIDTQKIPQSPEEMNLAYLSSSIYQRIEQERVDYKKYLAQELRHQNDFKEAVKQDQGKGVRKKSPYTVNLITQLQALIVRDIQLTLQDRKSLVFEWATAILLAIVIGSVFLNQPMTTAGAFTRGGVIFMGLLFNVFMSFSELPKQMLGRPIMWRQTSFCFYRPGARALAGAIAEIPFSLPKVFVFSFILYLMTNLTRTASAFFTYCLIVYMGYYTLSCFFKVLGAISFSFDTASRLASSLVILMTIYSGYMIPRRSMKDWLIWIYYMNPVNYAFSALMGNEFGRISLACTGDSIAPRGPGYPAGIGANQACTVLGSRPGSPIVIGEDYIRSNFSYSESHVWRNFVIVCAFAALFLILLFIAVETLALGSGSPAINVFAQENEERKKLNAKLQERKQDFRSGKATQDLSGLIQTRKPFTWEDLSYSVSVPGGQKKLLTNIYGYVKPGTLTALMGSSGAGKTTLLDVLADRKTTGVISGEICIAGQKPGADFQRGTAYCEQQDVHEWTATVREAMRFSAYLRQPAEVSIEEKNKYVEEMIQLLELEDLADAMIGFPGFGLGVEARKRLTIGVELAAKPQLLLFLDEPTSGLDGQSAYNIVRFLRKLATAGQAILCTIHQPNALLFENFDRLLLLKKGGRCVYFGDIGRDSHVIRSYFEKNGAKCPEDGNPAEFMLEAIGAGTSAQHGGTKDWADRWVESLEHAENMREIKRLKEESLKEQTHQGPSLKEMKYATSFAYQLKTVVDRTNLSFYRNADYEVTRVFNHVAIALITGLTFLRLSDGVGDLQNRIFAAFQVVILIPLITAQVEPTFIMARDIYLRESSSKMYTPVAFGVAQFLAEMPYSLVCAIVFYILWYFLVGFQSDSDRAGYAFLMVVALETYAVTLGQAIAALSPSMFIAAKANPPVIVILTLFCGVTVPKARLPGFWRVWLYELNPITRFISGTISNEMHDLPIICSSEEYTTFQPPSGQTCAQWAGPFVNSFGGYLLDDTVRSDCKYCQFSNGNEYLRINDMRFEDRWRDFGIFVVYIAANLVVIVLGSRFLTHIYAKR
ncbi:hypothetical protein PtA15_3A32 [Puccinia triticina]|uniref:ABC transporter domain-containing protein n=1 Tax=Puccinia triticina TaxID=208348 RepID=A0ABY7CCA0_9BASI|nr:uncharacterized protein PtA15_3A32 [Puccinia triticina]WAQ82669.1 hypothetical protein PtA15_3A32 [Puccinia triticina]